MVKSMMNQWKAISSLPTMRRFGDGGNSRDTDDSMPREKKGEGGRRRRRHAALP
jgi:hypothetical protein